MDNTEWLDGDEKELNYHLNQYKNTKEYTKVISKYLHEWDLTCSNTKTILDLGCGAGANCHYFAKNYNNQHFIGIDINVEYIKIANRLKVDNTEFHCEDFNMIKGFNRNIEGVLCLQTISWLESYEKIMGIIFNIKPDWILITSLFYDGPVDSFIKVKDYSRSMGDYNYRLSNYNIYSLPIFENYVSKNNYKISRAIKFEINCDLEQPVDKGMGTYTKRLENDSSRIQFSGPLLMPWYTLLIRKNIEKSVCHRI